jgi:hypothetical protein
MQPQAAGTSATGGLSSTTTTPFLATVAAAKNICMSEYVFTSVAFNALDTAAKNHANVVVVFPQESDSGSSASDLAQLKADGATVVIDPGAPTINPIHAKLAIVDGKAYLDGHNWVEATTEPPVDDVVLQDPDPTDYAAIQNALTSLTTVSSSSARLQTLKANSLAQEAAFLNANMSSITTGVQVHVMTESFSSGDGALVTALENAAAAGASVTMIVVKSDESGSSDTSLISTMQGDGITFCNDANTGSEKLLTISSVPGEVWFGSSNATSTSQLSDNYVDWGMLVTDSATITNINNYFAAQVNASTPFSSSMPCS